MSEILQWHLEGLHIGRLRKVTLEISERYLEVFCLFEVSLKYLTHVRCNFYSTSSGARFARVSTVDSQYIYFHYTSLFA